MFDTPDDVDQVSVDAMEDMFEAAAALALKHEHNGEAFIAAFIDCAINDEYAFFDPFLEQTSDMEMIAQVAWPLAISIWNAMPLPSNNYQPRPIAMPRRNEPCRCGSGRKFKQCCARLGDMIQFPVEQNMMTKYLLEELPATKLRDVWRHVPHQLIGEIGGEWANLDWDEAKRTLVMLDPIFRQPDAKLDYRDEAAFDAVIESCNVLDKPRKKKALIERLVRHRDKRLKAAALHRKCCMFSDNGDYDGAWQVFQEAQRADPDNPGLSHLEVLILLSQGKIEQMRQRGRYWIRRLTQMDAESYADLIDWIQTMVDSPAEGMGSIMEMQTPGASRLMAWIDERLADPPELQHRLDVSGENSCIEAKNQDAEKLLEGWQACFHQADLYGESDVWEYSDNWLDFLEQHPQAAGHFIILDDLMFATGQLGATNPALAFGALFDLCLRQLQTLLPEYPTAPVAWAVWDNRPALQVLATIIEMAREAGNMTRAQALMEWMLRLNPNDNMGFRGPLTTIYLGWKEYDKALTLCEKYPDDFDAEVAYGRALAQFCTGDGKQAEQLLLQAIDRLPKVGGALLKKNMKRPRDAQEGQFQVGGDDQAWFTREQCRDLWVETPGALDWLKSHL